MVRAVVIPPHTAASGCSTASSPAAIAAIASSAPYMCSPYASGTRLCRASSRMPARAPCGSGSSNQVTPRSYRASAIRRAVATVKVSLPSTISSTSGSRLRSPVSVAMSACQLGPTRTLAIRTPRSSHGARWSACHCAGPSSRKVHEA